MKKIGYFILSIACFHFIANTMEAPAPSIPESTEFTKSFFSTVPADILTIISSFLIPNSLDQALTPPRQWTQYWHDIKVQNAYKQALKNKFGQIAINKALFDALKKGNLTHAEQLYAIAGADSNARQKLQISPEIKKAYTTPLLCYFAGTGPLKSVQWLLSHGAYINMQDSTGATPLHEAIDGNLPHVVVFLLQNGANINSADKSGITPLMRAIDEDALDIVKILLNRRPDLNRKDKKGNTALMHAQQKENPELIDILKKQINQ